MNILLIGSGGREHAITKALAESPSCDTIYCTPGNPGIFEYAEKAEVSSSDFDSIKSFCKEKNIDLLAVGPEQPLADGIADAFAGSNTAVFGPSKYAAQIESSKDFAKKIMVNNNVPTSSYKTFLATEQEKAKQYIQTSPLPIVLKADGLAGGKGVVIAEEYEDAFEAIEDIFSGKFGTAAGNRVVIEDFMRGEEASVFAVCDGKDYVTLAPAQDHKRVGDGDTGKNTGGMGAYAPAPIVTEEVLNKTKSQIIEPVLKAMADEGHPFIGCLYCGLMIEDGNPKVVEFNCRFGDPETQAVLPLFRGDLAELFLSAAKGKINKSAFEGNSEKAAVCIILTAEGYPESYEKGKEITGLKDSSEDGITVYHAGTKEQNGKIISNGGRVLGITAVDDSIEKAVEKAYRVTGKIDFENKYFRTDIAHRALTK